MKRRSGLLAYFLGAFGIAWAGILLIATQTGLPAVPGTPDGKRGLVFLFMIAGPSLSSIGLTVLLGGRRGLREMWERLARFKVGARWAAAFLIAPALLALTLALLSLTSPAYLPGILTSASPASAIAFALVVGLGAGLFEELGWTGFATPRLLERYSWPLTGLGLGLLWAAWHGLADYWGGAVYGSLWSLHMFEWVVALTAYRILMTWVYAHTGSLLFGVLMHAVFAGSQALLWPAAEPWREVIWYGAFAAALWLPVAVVVLRARRSASRGASREDAFPTFSSSPWRTPDIA